jgi:hypothetical protein
MSKIMDELLPEDFGKSFDTEVFAAWKKSVKEHEQTGISSLLLFLAGLAAMILLGGIVGVGLFFILAFIGIGISMPKKKKVTQYQKQLGINGKEIRDAITIAKKRV